MKKIKYVIKTEESIRRNKIILYCIIIAIIVISLVCYFKFFKISNATEEIAEKKTIEKVNIEPNENIINIDNILRKNTKNTAKKTLVIDEIDLEYTTTYKDNPELPQGVIQVVQEGRDGLQEVIVIKTFEGDEFVGEERVKSRITKASVNRIVEVGSSDVKIAQKVEAGDTVYVTPETLTIKNSKSSKAKTICTINKDESVTVIDIEDNWYRVRYNSYIGYAEANCFAKRNPNAIGEIISGTEYTKEQLLTTLDFNMNLNQPSGLTLEQFKKVLSGNPSDKNHVLSDNAEYFYYIEQEYKINGIFIASMAIHEGGWGNSSIANSKKNLFGYGAYDSDPSGGAYEFGTYAEGIDLVARVLVKYYINPPGTILYNGETASGKYYNGSTLTGVNTRYATDKNWANAVFKWMTYLYNRL